MDLCGPKTFETESNKYQAARTELGGSSIKSLTWGTKMLMISVSALVLIDSKKCSKCLAHALTLHSAMFCANSILVLEICYCYFKSLKEKITQPFNSFIFLAHCAVAIKMIQNLQLVSDVFELFQLGNYFIKALERFGERNYTME